MAVGFSNTNKPLNPRGNDASPKGYNRAALYSGKALDFDGVNDVVTTTYTSGFTGAQEFTYCAYVNADDIASAQAVVHANETTGWGLQSFWVASNTFRFYAGSGTESTSFVNSETIEANKWYFVVGVHTPTENKIYLNGVLNATAAAANLTAAPQAITIGRFPSVTLPFNGEISNAKVFNTALTAAQVADLYNNPEKVVPTGVAESNLKLWLPMMEGAGTTAYDGSGNGNHGTISGATWQHGIGAPVSQTAVIDWNKGSNLYAYSEQFDESSYWSYTQIHAVDSTGNEAPDGSLTADKLIANTNTAFHHIGRFVTGITSGVSYRVSVYVKAAGHDYILVNTGTGSTSGNAGPIVNLTNGSIAGSLNGEDYDATITDAGNGWYKIEYDFTSSGTIINIDYNQLPSASITAYAGDNTKGVYLWGASLRPASSGSTYVRTGATAQTSEVLLPQGLTTGRDITGVNLFENVRKQGALNLDGKSWAEVHDNGSLDFGTGSFTLEAWVRVKFVAQGSSYNVVMTLGGNLSSQGTSGFIINSSKVPVYIYNNNISGSGSISEGTWIHMVGVYNETNATIYVNGSQVDQDERTAASITNTLVKQIGRDTTATRYYNDQIAQPRIYNRALTASEVLQNYNSGKNTYK